MTTAIESQHPRIHTPKSIIWSILLISALASAFIFWLVYVHPPVDKGGSTLHFLPALNAVFNAMATIALVTGFVYIMKLKVKQHRASMFTAFIFSTLFLVSYLANYFLHGEYKLPIAHTGTFWWTYLVLLISHITLSVIALPMVLITFFFSLTERFPQHRAIAKYTFPVWLYVSVTGVAVFLMQAAVR